MKKYSILLAVIVLVLASLACQTIMGGGNVSVDNGSSATAAPESTDGGNGSVGNDSPFPVASDATNVTSASGTVSYQTKLSADDLMNFYRDELGKQGFTEKTDVTTNFGGIIAMVFEGNGKTIVLGGAPSGDGSLLVTLAYQP